MPRDPSPLRLCVNSGKIRATRVIKKRKEVDVYAV